MPFSDVSTIDVASSGPTVKFAVRILSNGMSKVTFTLNKAALSEWFGGAAPGDKFRIQSGSGAEAGLVVITRHQSGHHVLKGQGTRGVCTLNTSAWQGVIGKTVKTRPCVLKAMNDQGVILELPK